MQYTPPAANPGDPDWLVYNSLESVIRGMGMFLIELSINRIKSRSQRPQGKSAGKLPSVQIRAVVYRDGITGIEDCSMVHRGIIPRLELAFPGQDIYLEVSSPGINRLIKDGSEFSYYIGKGVRCYRTDISDWTAGILLAADDEKIILRGGDGETTLPYEIIAKARLDIASPVFGKLQNKSGG